MLPDREYTESSLSISADHILGPAAAPVIILEYGCCCATREAGAFAAICQVRNVFPDQVAFVFRHFPLVVTYPSAFETAEAAEAAARQGQFWRMHRYLAEHAHPYTRAELIQVASKLELDADAVASDLESHVHRDLVTGHFQSAVRSGVRRVPAIFINGEPFTGELTAEALRLMVQRAGARALGRPW